MIWYYFQSVNSNSMASNLMLIFEEHELKHVEIHSVNDFVSVNYNDFHLTANNIMSNKKYFFNTEIWD